MAEGEGHSLITCPEDYLKSLKSFYASLALEQENYFTTPTSKCVKEHAATLIKDYVRDLLEDHSPFCILGVGSGDGSSDLSFIEILIKDRHERLDTKSQFFQRTIEPDKKVLQVFRAKAGDLPESMKTRADIEFEWCPMTFQEYVKQKNKHDVKFDVVHFFHSLYYAGLETALEHSYEKELGAKGVILCFINDEQSAMSKYYQAFSSRGMILNREAYHDSKDITDVAKKNRWKYVKCPSDIKICDITAIFDRSSVEGNHLLAFLTHWANIRLTSSQENQQKILSFWKDQCIEDGRGRKMLTWKTRAVMIIKGM